MDVRRWMLLTHRWLGLGSAIVQVTAGATGVALLFDLGPAIGEPTALFHEQLLAGATGRWIVFAATAVALVLQATGLWLWWPPQPLRLRTDRGWWRLGYDLHNLSGILTLPITVLLAATGVGRVLFEVVPPPASLEIVHRVVGRLHSASGFPLIVKVAYALGSAAFVVQAITGLLVWWRPVPSRATK